MQSCEQAASALGGVLSKECFAAGSSVGRAESSASPGLGGCFAPKDSAFWVRHKAEVLDTCIFFCLTLVFLLGAL